MAYAAVGLNHDMMPVFLGLMLASVIAWFFLSSRLYAELREKYPLLYDKLGRPRLFMKKSIAANFKVARFLLRREYAAVNNPGLARLCQGLRSLFCLYLVCLVGALFLLADRLG